VDKFMVLTTGTWGEKSEEEWHKNEKWKDDLRALGVKQLDHVIPFVWSSNLDGLIGENYDWLSAGRALNDYVGRRILEWDIVEPINFISHSHGMQVLAYAAYFGLSMGTVITVAGPRRDRLDSQYSSLKQNSQCWIHVHSNWRDHWQMFGSLRLTRPWITSRKMKEADKNVYIPDKSHTGLMDFQLLRNNGIFRSIIAGEVHE
jgi:hypothetical protein